MAISFAQNGGCTFLAAIQSQLAETHTISEYGNFLEKRFLYECQPLALFLNDLDYLYVR